MKQCLDFLNSYHLNSDVMPTFEEIQKQLGLKSKQGVHRILTSLEERGFITRIPHRARAIFINKENCPLCGVSHATKTTQETTHPDRQKFITVRHEGTIK